MDYINFLIKKGSDSVNTQELEVIELLLRDYKHSKPYADILEAKKYYHNQNTSIHSMMDKHLTTYTSTTVAKSKDGAGLDSLGSKETHVDVRYEPYKHKVTHPVYKQVVDEKIDYIFSNPFSVTSENKVYGDLLELVFNPKLRRLFKEWVREAVISGSSYLHPYYEKDQLKFKLIPTAQLMPICNDDGELEQMCHFYTRKVVKNGRLENQEEMDLYDTKTKRHYVRDSSRWLAEGEEESLLEVNGQVMELKQVPFIKLKANFFDEPLLVLIKTLIDDLDFVKSQSQKAISKLTDTILVLKKAGGTSLETVIESLETAGILKTHGDCDVDAIATSLNTQDLMLHIQDTKKSIHEYAHTVGLTDKEGVNLSGIALKLLYVGLSNDANNLIASIRESFEEMLYFVNLYLELTGQGCYYNESAAITFVKSELLNESEEVDTLLKLYESNLLSRETLLSKTSYVQDVGEEINRIKEGK